MTEQPVLDGVALDRLRRIGGDTLVRKMIALYLEHGPGRVQAMKDGLETGDAEQVERAAHTMKSSAGNMGAVRLQHAAEAVETLAVSGAIHPATIEDVIREYADSAAALQRVLDEEVP